MVAHDLRSPLGAITASATLLQERALASSQRERQLALMDRAARRMARLLDDVLDLSRIEAGSFRLRPMAVAASELLAALVSDVGWLAGDCGVMIHPPLGGEPERELRVDAQQTRRALEALLRHAVLQTPPRGSVSLTLHERHSAVELEIRHGGRPYTPQDVDALFRWSWRRSGGHSTCGEASMALANRILTVQSGSVEVVHFPGGQPAFRVLLPRNEDVADVGPDR